MRLVIVDSFVCPEECCDRVVSCMQKLLAWCFDLCDVSSPVTQSSPVFAWPMVDVAVVNNFHPFFHPEVQNRR